MKNKNQGEGEENKIIGDFNCTMDEMPDSSEFNGYNKSLGTRSTMDRAYTNIKMASNTKINHIMVSCNDHYNAILIGRFPSKLNWKRFMVL